MIPLCNPQYAINNVLISLPTHFTVDMEADAYTNCHAINRYYYFPAMLIRQRLSGNDCTEQQLYLILMPIVQFIVYFCIILLTLNPLIKSCIIVLFQEAEIMEIQTLLW